MRKPSVRAVRKLRDVRINTIDNRRTDVSLPKEVLERAKVKAGDMVEIYVTSDLRIVLRPLRAEWPTSCGRREGCLLAERHEGECCTDEDVPY